MTAAGVLPLLTAARSHAALGAWGELRVLLSGRAEETAKVPELVTLLAEAQLRTGHPRDAQTWLEERLDGLRASGDAAALRRGTNLLGAACFELGALDAARAAFESALELARRDGDDLLVARAMHNLATIASLRGRREEALALFELAIPAYQVLGNARGLAESHHNLAIACRELGRLEEADEHERRAIEFAREAEVPRMVAIARVGRAEISLRRGDPWLAGVAARRAATDLAAIGDPAMEADARRLAGVSAIALDDIANARRELDRAVELAVTHGSALIEAESRRARATLAAAEGQLTRAMDDAAVAAALFGRLGLAAERDAIGAWVRERAEGSN